MMMVMMTMQSPAKRNNKRLRRTRQSTDLATTLDHGRRRRRNKITASVFFVLVALFAKVTWAFLPLSMHRPKGNAASLLLKRTAAQSANSNHNHKNEGMLDLRLLLIDHYDSFTYNLVDMLGQHCVHPPLVIAADTPPEEVQRIWNDGGVDGIILSPGPGNPETCGPLAASLVRKVAAQHPEIPVLGVCLGHQILGTLYGATCTKAPTPVHGQVQSLQFLSAAHEDDALWQRAFDLVVAREVCGDRESTVPSTSSSSSIPRNEDQDWQVTRYHSLHVTNLNQSPLIPTSTTTTDAENNNGDGEIVMSFRHPHLPHYGVQFHPESVGSKHGWALLRAFCEICQENKQDKRESSSSSSSLSTSNFRSTNDNEQRAPNNGTMNGHTHPTEKASKHDGSEQTTVVVYKVPQSSHVQPWNVMKDLLGDSNYRYWLDTADERTNAISILGTADDERVEYWGQEVASDRRGVYVYKNNAVDPQRFADLDIITYLDQQQTQPTNAVTWLDLDPDNHQLMPVGTSNEGVDVLPFSFRGGYVGYLGYEVRHDTSDYLTKVEGGQPCSRKEPLLNSHSSTPTAAFMKAEKSFVFCHDQKQWFLIGNVRSNDPRHKATVLQWMTDQARILQEYQPSTIEDGSGYPPQSTRSRKPRIKFTPNRSKETYNDNFEACLEQIRQGESYELCLTNQLETTVKTRSTPLDLYKVLRHRNPAPFSAFFDWNSGHQIPSGSSFAICCSSPERFASIMPQPDGTMRVEAKPIKGTCARVLPERDISYRSAAEEREDFRRAEELRSSVKNRAENLMIVDLLRNDLSRTCRTGSVHVSKLMDIESFATVHQMVSTIRGTLDAPLQSAVSTLRASFPGGSMTGAPKLRTMEILDNLEEGVPRGPYSGCLGYISTNGAMDMNIIIRTAIVTPVPQVGSWKVCVGAGGAITILSESEDEYEEMILKARAVVAAVDEWGATETTHCFKNELYGSPPSATAFPRVVSGENKK